jgi:hypothetical protein
VSDDRDRGERTGDLGGAPPPREPERGVPARVPAPRPPQRDDASEADVWPELHDTDGDKRERDS